MTNFHQDNTTPTDTAIFVFGSNLAGRHGAGAAKAAWQYYGAEYGHAIGLTGTSYAIPTKDENFGCLTLDQIRSYVDQFVQYTIANPQRTFFVTRVGCGLAGNADQDIAPMFADCGSNCSFAVQWQPYLT